MSLSLYYKKSLKDILKTKFEFEITIMSMTLNDELNIQPIQSLIIN